MSHSTLERRLGPLDAAAIIVANVIGGGILFTPPQVAAAVPSAFWFLGAWVAGGALAFAGAMAYAELAALRPRAGGEYVYLREAFGRLAAFLTGWTSFVAGFTGAIAASAIVLTFYLERFIAGASNSTPFFVIPLPYVPLTFSRQTLVAIAAIVLMAWIHLRGVGPGRIMGNVLAALKVSALLMFIALGVSIGSGSSANLAASSGPVFGSAWLLALIPVMFTYSGWNAAGYIAEEIRDPGRNVPRAFALGTAAVIFVYLALNALYLYVLPVGELARVQGSVLDVIADRLLGARAGDVMGLVSIISLAASISAMTFAGPRVYYAMARDGLFFDAAARVHPKYRTPAAAIIAQAVWASLLVLSGSAEALTNYTGFAIVLFAGIAVMSLFVIRRREPAAPRPFRAIGYPVAPAIFVMACFLIVVNAIYSRPGPTGAGLVVMGAGIPLYLWLTRRARVS
ncbi:MAG TPA: amino acid permease [Vicinamibacterales bacterium]|nr:amino acid permease [Vicinamibacterales bacterium]